MTTTRTRLLARLATLAVLMSTLLGTAWAPPAAAQSDDEVQIPDPPDPDEVPRREMLVTDPSGRALDGGGSQTYFGVELEGEDECPGDSAHDQYRINSYMVPIDIDPTQLHFTALGPTPIEFQDYDGFQMPLYKLSTHPYAAELTAQQIEPGAPGPIREIPNFDFRVYVPTPGIDGYDGGLPSGEYRIGIACTYAGRITNLWETTIELTQDPEDEPVGIAWTVSGPQPLELETASSTFDPTVPLGLVGVVMAGIALFLYRSSRTGDGPAVDDGGDEPTDGEPARTPESVP